MAQTSRSSPAIGGAVPTQCWRTIVWQRVQLESTNAELETRVAERVKQLKEALDQGRRRLEAFRITAGRLAIEKDPERALQDLGGVSRDLVGARYGALALADHEGVTSRLVVSGFSPEQQSRMRAHPRRLGELGLARVGVEKIVVDDVARHLSAHGLARGDASDNGFIGVQVLAKGEHSGAFYFMEKEGGPDFTADDERLLNLFAMLVGVHLENVSLYDGVTQERRALAAIQASMTEGLVVLDPKGRVMYLNETAERLWGLSPDEVRDKHISEVYGPMMEQFEPPEAKDGLLQLAEKDGDSPKSVEVTLIGPPRRHLAVTAFSIPGGSDQSMVGLLARDITQERELQDRRNAFVSIASHELRTPMTTIMGFSELLLQDDLPESSLREWVERIHQNSQILSAIVDDMLNVSRIQSGRLALNLEPLQLPGIVDEVLAGIEPETEVHEFHVDIPRDMPDVVADREKLSQVLINLVTNAVKYSPQGGPITILARNEAERERVVVEVVDRGMGISPEERASLFTTFHRIRRPETQEIKGTGLGLSIVKGLVGLMRGEVWVESQMNKGSSFFFTVPTRRDDVLEEDGTLSAI